MPYVYASYVNDRNNGYVAVIDPYNHDRIIKRISGLISPSAMCTDPSEQKLYVTDDRLNRVNIYRTDNFGVVAAIRVGTKADTNPVAVFVAPNGKKVYVANYGEHSVTIIDANAYTVIKNVEMATLQPGVLGRPFAFACNENSAFVHVACKRDNGADFLVAIGLEDDTAYSLDFEEDIIFDQTRNPLAIHPNGHTLVSLGDVGMLNYFGDRPVGLYNSISLLDNTVSGVYLNNKMLFCTLRGEKNYLKVFKNLEIDRNRNITYDNFIELPSYKSQDTIRASRNQIFVGVTVQPTVLPMGGLQIIEVASLRSRFVGLDVVRDMTFFSDEKAYVVELSSVLPIDLGSMLLLPRIQIGGNDITVRKVISGYSNQST